MPIVPCPKCGNRVSSNAAICSNCGYERGEASDADRQKFQRRQLREYIYHLRMASYGVMAVVLLAFAWVWVATGGLQVRAGNNGPYYLMVGCAIAYLVVRALMFRARRRQKASQGSSLRRGEFPGG